MEFDQYTVSVLESPANPPKLSEKEANDIQNAHPAYLASLHDAGQLEAAGPFTSPPGRTLRGLGFHRLPPEEVQALLEKDPAVRAGELTFRVLGWMVPKGAVAFGTSRFPRSMAED